MKKRLSSMKLALRSTTYVESSVFQQVHFITGVVKYAGLEINEAKRLKELELENNKLKKLLAERKLEVEALKDVLSKKW